MTKFAVLQLLCCKDAHQSVTDSVALYGEYSDKMDGHSDVQIRLIISYNIFI